VTNLLLPFGLLRHM